MTDLSADEQKNLSKFIEYSLNLVLKGFDEMEINKRLELVKLSACVFDIFFNKMFLKISDLENRVKALEEKNKKK